MKRPFLRQHKGGDAMDCSSVFQRIHKLSLTSLFLLLCENEELLSLSVRKLAEFCSVSPKTMSWYLEDLKSLSLIESTPDGGIRIPRSVYPKMFVEFAENISNNQVFLPEHMQGFDLSSVASTWFRWLCRLYCQNRIIYRYCTVSAVEKELKSIGAKDVFRLDRTTGIIKRQEVFYALPGDFLLQWCDSKDQWVLIKVD